MTETIAAAAVLHEGVIYSKPRPHRHHHILHEHVVTDEKGNILRGKLLGGRQGFVTDTGRFVDRREACEIAREANQIVQKHGPDDVLFSEDMW